MRSFLTAVLALACVVATAQPAQAMWSLGANLGFTVHDPADPDDDGYTFVGIPTAPSAFFLTPRPGLRVGFAGEKMDHEGFLDLGYDGFYFQSDNIQAMRIGGNYQYNFGSSGMRPFVTAGVGLFRVGADSGESISATSMTYGAGAGVGFPVSQGVGRLRVEARFDKQQEADDDGNVIVDEATIWNIGFGFDLWIK